MKVIRIVLLIGNGVWLPDFIVEKFSKLYFFATYPTAHDYIFASVLLAAAIPTVTGSFTLAGNIAYMGLIPPHAQNEIRASASRIMRASRIALLIGNGFMLLAQVIGGPMFVFSVAKREGFEWPFDADAWAVMLPQVITTVVCIFILAGSIVYIWRFRPRSRNEKGASASHAPDPPVR
jgi:hypothetical protein